MWSPNSFHLSQFVYAHRQFALTGPLSNSHFWLQLHFLYCILTEYTQNLYILVANLMSARLGPLQFAVSFVSSLHVQFYLFFNDFHFKNAVFDTLQASWALIVVVARLIFQWVYNA